MAPMRKNLFFWSSFIFLWWAGAAKEITTRKTKDSSLCDDKVSSKRAGSIICGEPAGKHCFKYSCYTFNTAAKTWEDSQKDCKKNGGYLVSIEKKEELVFLQEKIKELKLQQHRGWYIGLSVKEPLWLWVNGKTLTINHFRRKPGREPSSYSETKVVIDKNLPTDRDFTWNDIFNTTTRGSICETERTGGAKTGNGVYCSKTSCYTFVETEKTWEDSRKECRKKSSDLVSIETESEWAFIINIINTHLRNTKNFKTAKGWVIGLEKNPKATWKWSNKASYTLGREVWGESSPYGRSNYAFMKIAKSPKHPVGIFFDAENDSDLKPYICENNLLDKAKK